MLGEACLGTVQQRSLEMTSATDRPTGVTIMAVVAAIVGVTDILAGLGDIGFAGEFLSDHGFGDTLDGS